LIDESRNQLAAAVARCRLQLAFMAADIYAVCQLEEAFLLTILYDTYPHSPRRQASLLSKDQLIDIKRNEIKKTALARFSFLQYFIKTRFVESEQNEMLI
jgi:hypothetical protein